MVTSTSDWPSAVNTGVPAGVTLTPSGSLVIDTPGVVISGLDIHGTVYINAPNVTLINCNVTSSAFNVVQIAQGITGAVVQNCTINGVGSGNDGSNGIAGQGTFIANNIYNVENGITLQGNNSIIRDNYIHDLNASGSPHYDGIQIDGGISGATITHNTVINSHDQTAAVMIDNYFGPISNITVDNNVLVGGGYTIYCDAQFNGGSITGVSITNNHVGGGYWGSTDFNGSSPVYTGNVSDGETLAAGLPTTGQPPAPTAPSAPTIASFSNDSGTAGDGVTNDSTLTLTGNAAANSAVQVFDGTTQIGTTTANSSGAWTYTTAALSDGGHNLTARASTTSGTSAASSNLAVTIDTRAPTAPTMATPTTNANGGVNLTGTAEANSVVKVYDGTTQIGTATANSSGVWGYTTGTLATGSHSLTARATDTAGNTSAASVAVAVTTTTTTAPAPTAPTITSFSNDTGVAGDRITSDNTLTLTGTAAANSTVKVFDGTTQIGTATSSSNGTWSYTTAALTDGNHSLTATVTDGSGHTSAASSTLAVRVDTTAPTAPHIGSYTSDAAALASSTISGATANATTGTANVDHLTLNGTAEANSTVRVFDGTTQIGTTTTNSSGAWSYNASNLADGSHSFTSRAVDAAGNTSAPSSSLAVNVNTHTEAPTVDFTNAWQKWNDKVAFRGTTDPNTQITIHDTDGTAVGTVRAGADGRFSLTTSSALSDEVVHRFTATVTDSTGQPAPSSGSVVLGTTGDERLTGTSGNDLFRGNGGHDTFEFAANFGRDVITDFRATTRGHDVVEFSRTVFDNFADVLAHASQSGQDVVIDAGGGNTLTLKNTSLTALDRTDFHFV